MIQELSRGLKSDCGTLFAEGFDSYLQIYLPFRKADTAAAVSYNDIFISWGVSPL